MVSTSVSLRLAKGKTLANTAPAANGSASQRPLPHVQTPLPQEVDGEQREGRTGWRSWRRTTADRHSGLIGWPNSAGTLTAKRRGDGQAQDDERLGALRCSPTHRRVGGHDQLLPQPLGVRARELARQRVEAAHALDRDQERFISRQPGLGERRQLVAEMPLELFHVGTVNGLPAEQVGPPLRDLLLERSIGEGRHAVHAFIQRPRRVSSTTCHCCRWAASCARPSLVIR